MVLQSAWVTCTEEHSTSDHPDNTLPCCKPMHEVLMRQPKSLHKFGEQIVFFKNSTNSLQNGPLKWPKTFLQNEWPQPSRDLRLHFEIAI